MDPSLYKAMHQVEECHWWFTARRQIVQRLLQSLSLPADARLLDMGCGTGGNLQMLSRFGEVTAIELEPAARALAEGRHIAPVYAGSLPDELPPLAPFDGIVLLDVLEHVEEDLAALRRLATLLKPDGALIVTVPALPWLWGHHDEIHHHHRRYTRQSLQQLAESAGLSVEKISYCNSWLFPLVAMTRLLERLLPSKGETSTGLSIPPTALNKLLHFIFASEASRITKGGFPIGVSLIAVLRCGDA